MSFDLETYKQITGRLDVDDIDFEAFRDQPLAADHLRCLRYIRRIMRQEGRHIDFYRHRAVEHLASRGAQRMTRALIRTLWHPVGAQVIPVAETRHLVRTLFADEDGAAIAARIDRRVDALPGLEGLGLMRQTIATYGTAA